MFLQISNATMPRPSSLVAIFDMQNKQLQWNKCLTIDQWRCPSVQPVMNSTITRDKVELRDNAINSELISSM